jgi:DNA sulfur modification protein DndE
MSLERIQLSQQAKDQLTRLKRRTGLKNWNVLCRWAFCVSIAEPDPPTPARIPADSSIEMTWRTFAGSDHEDVYLALLRQRCADDGLPTDPGTLAAQFRLHLHRGIGYLAGTPDLRSIDDLAALAL